MSAFCITTPPNVIGAQLLDRSLKHFEVCVALVTPERRCSSDGGRGSHFGSHLMNNPFNNVQSLCRREGSQLVQNLFGCHRHVRYSSVAQFRWCGSSRSGTPAFTAMAGPHNPSSIDTSNSAAASQGAPRTRDPLVDIAPRNPYDLVLARIRPANESHEAWGGGAAEEEAVASNTAHRHVGPKHEQCPWFETTLWARCLGS